jgi:hypothetical protein
MTIQRVQFRRGVKGWRKPVGAKYVGRQRGKSDSPVGTPNYWGNPYKEKIYGRERAMALYRRDVEALSEAEREAWLAPLRKFTALMCFCRLDEVCHADVLLGYLNRP